MQAYVLVPGTSMIKAFSSDEQTSIHNPIISAKCITQIQKTTNLIYQNKFFKKHYHN